MYIHREPTLTKDNFIHDPDISWKAKGLLCKILVLGEEWELNISELIRSSKDGRVIVSSSIKELELSGYLQRAPRKGDHGMFVGWKWSAADTPVFRSKKERKKLTQKR